MMNSSSPRRLLLWLAPLTFLGVFFFYPFFHILAFSFSFETLTSNNLQFAIQVLGFTFYQAALSTLLTLLIGLPSAYLFAHFEFPGKSLLRALTAVPFMLPTVVVAAGFNALFGPRGWANLALMHLIGLRVPPINFVGTLAAILLAHIFYNTTIVIRVVGNAFARLDPRLEQAARTLGADSPRVWWNVFLPVLRPSLLAASLLVFLFDFTSFGVVLLLGGPRFATLEVAIYIQALQLLNLPLAALLSLIQLLCTLAFSILYTRTLTRSTVQTSPRSPLAHHAKTLREKTFVFSFCILLFAFFILPMLALPLRSISRLDADRGERAQIQAGLTTGYYTELFVNRNNSIFYVPPVQAAANSLIYASATVVLSLLLGFPAA
ncbi:MAG TPA: ABC transporter permease subunit, partial [Anaerolineales bacterium]|nr:ABC transporter permease subunit [Anaerolineales bacterium]